jgi:hypothetical protein
LLEANLDQSPEKDDPMTQEPDDPFQRILNQHQQPDHEMPQNHPKAEQDQELDIEIEELTTQLQLSNLPNPGNLRSSKRKDIRMRLRCIQAMLQQRQKDQ